MLPYMKPQKKRASDQNRVCFTLVQELGRHNGLRMDTASLNNARCHENYMTTYLYIWFNYVQIDLAKSKIPLRGLSQL